MTGEKHLSGSSNGAAFGASFNSEGKSQRDFRAHIVVLPGGTMIVDVALDINPGRPVSGPIHCENGR